MDAETKQALEAMEARMGAMEMRILERIEATETKLLTAFHGWASATDAKLKGLPIFDERLGIMEQRITALERKNLERGM